MAEAWTEHLKGDLFEAYSAGVDARGIDPRAVRVMAEAGIDISDRRAKHVDTLADIRFDYVVTLCDNARETCPFFPADTAMVHAGFDDPPKLAASARSEEEALEHYRRVRDEIRAYVEGMPGSLEADEAVLQ
jgi:arsenate reductase